MMNSLEHESDHGFSAMLGRRRIRRPLCTPYVVGDVNYANAYRLRVIHISDTLNHHDKILPQIPDGDILVHSGNFSHCRLSRKLNWQRNLTNQLEVLNTFFGKLPHRYKIFVPGNHEVAFEQASAIEIQSQLKSGIIYLQDNGCVLEGLKFWGIPWSYSRRGTVANAFSKPSYEALQTHWSNIPEDTQVLVSHMPPTEHEEIYKHVVTKIRPRVALFGHVRESHYEIKWKDDILFCNAAVASNYKHSSNTPRPIVLDYYVSSSDDTGSHQTILPPGATPPVLSLLHSTGSCHCPNECFRHQFNSSIRSRSRSVSGASSMNMSAQHHATTAINLWHSEQSPQYKSVLDPNTATVERNLKILELRGYERVWVQHY